MKVFHSSQTEMANIVNKITQHRTRSGKIYSHFVKLTMNEIQKKRVRKWGLALDQRNTQHNELVLTEARLTASVINVCSIHQPKFLRSKLAHCFHIQIHHLSFISGLWIDANTFFFLEAIETTHCCSVRAWTYGDKNHNENENDFINWLETIN